MNRNRITVRYAKALVEMASEQQIEMEIYSDFELLFKALSEYPAFECYLRMPRISTSDKIKKVHQLFSDSFNKLSLRFIVLVIDHQRGEYIKDIVRNIVTFMNQKQGIYPALLKTAQSIDDELVKKIKNSFENKLDKTIQLHVESDYRLIGGFVFTLDNIQYDASLATRLKNIQKQFQ